MEWEDEKEFYDVDYDEVYRGEELWTDINTIFGAVINENLTDEVIVTVIATGFEEPGEPLYHSFNSTNKEEMYQEDDYNDNDLDIPPFIRDRQDF
mgnify:CR=1 FL=1